MQYDEYLANGWPIASGPVEGACKNLIKDRMERSGMRWTEQMAEAIVQLRAVHLSGDFDRYWIFHIEQDQKRLYPGAWSVVQSSHTRMKRNRQDSPILLWNVHDGAVLSDNTRPEVMIWGQGGGEKRGKVLLTTRMSIHHHC